MWVCFIICFLGHFKGYFSLLFCRYLCCMTWRHVGKPTEIPHWMHRRGRCKPYNHYNMYYGWSGETNHDHILACHFITNVVTWSSNGTKFTIKINIKWEKKRTNLWLLDNTVYEFWHWEYWLCYVSNAKKNNVYICCIYDRKLMHIDRNRLFYQHYQDGDSIWFRLNALVCLQSWTFNT